MKKKEKINYETQYIYGVQVVCKEWIPKDLIFTITSPDERGLQQVIITKINPSQTQK